jgi:hypothetical protein
MPRRLVVAVLAVCVTALVAGCASAVDGTGSLPDPQSVVLHTNDLPSWGQSPSDSDNDPNVQLADCAGVQPGQEIDSADSVDFDRGTSFVSSTASVMRSIADVKADIASLLSPRFTKCARELLPKVLAKNAPSNGHVSNINFQLVRRHAGEPKRLIATGVGRVTFSVSGESATLFFDMAFLAGTRMEALVFFGKVGARMTAAFERKIEAIVASRLG